MTPKRIVRRRRARGDVDTVIDYYLNVANDAVAFGFVDSLEEALRSIAMVPESGSSRYADGADLKGLRFWPLKHYPYLIFYFDLADAVDVWRILHAGRDIPHHLS